jgi:hypothetical protein
MKTEDLQEVIATLNEVIRLPYGKAPDLDTWKRLIEARSVIQVALYQEEYRNLGKLPEVTA